MIRRACVRWNIFVQLLRAGVIRSKLHWIVFAPPTVRSMELSKWLSIFRLAREIFNYDLGGYFISFFQALFSSRLPLIFDEYFRKNRDTLILVFLSSACSIVSSSIHPIAGSVLKL